jgi:hypothetical protein
VQVSGDLRALGLDDALAALSESSRISRTHHGMVSTPTPSKVASTASMPNCTCDRSRLPNRNTPIPVATNSAPASTRQSAARPPPVTPLTPDRAPAVQRLRCASSASRHTTAAPTAATPSGPTIHPTTVLPSAAAASPAPTPSAASPTACWRSVRPNGRGTSIGSCRTNIHSRP